MGHHEYAPLSPGTSEPLEVTTGPEYFGEHA